MPSFLLAWNPKRWEWQDLPRLAEKVSSGEAHNSRWSCGNSKSICKGDRVFLIKLGVPPKGIIASGMVVKEPYWDNHWRGPAIGKKALFIEFRFDTLLNTESDVILPLEVLRQPPLSEMNWSTQISGVRIPDSIAAELEMIWTGFSKKEFVSADEIEVEGTYLEGSYKSVSVNAYERNPIARQKCITHYGPICSICGIDFEKVYGEVGKGYIHVHHLVAISDIGKEYSINPVKDLRPVCPNCHAMLHRRKPPYSIDELIYMVRERQ